MVVALFAAFVIGGAGSPTAPARFCSMLPFGYTRGPRSVHFIGVALSDTAPAKAGTVQAGIGEGHFGVSQRRRVYGQIVTVDRVGSPWRHLIPASTRRVILVPWDYDSACQPLVWGRSARFVTPTTPGVYHGLLREPRDWLGDVPTLDVFTPMTVPYPSALREDRAILESEPGARRVPPLTPAQYLDLREVLPVDDSLEVDPESASRAAEAWATSNPGLARAWPASMILILLRSSAEDARIRNLTVPMAGTYRIVVAFGTGDSTVMFGVTETHPFSTIDYRFEDDIRKNRRELVGYYFNAYLGAAASALEPDKLPTYLAASLRPVLRTADSTVYRGELNPLVEVSRNDPRPQVRAHARSLYGASERLRDRDYYFMPGIWVMYRNGRVRYAWTGRRDGRLVYSVRAERVSIVTRPARAR